MYKKLCHVVIFVSILLIVGFKNDMGTLINKRFESSFTKNSSREIKLRKFPYPFKSMLAISTDIDATSLHTFEETHRFMNTKEETPMGTGLGLDIANSFWMYVSTDKDGFIDVRKNTWLDQMSYFKHDWTEVQDAEKLKKYIQVGWIDTIHSFGDFSMESKSTTNFTREHGIKAIERLENDGIKINVWTNHGNESNIQNFGGNYNFTKYQQGDLAGSQGYHTDITVPYGIEFLWDSLGDDQLGHDSVLFPIELGDGQKIWGFKKFSHVNKKKDIRWLWGIYTLGEQLSEKNLKKIVNKGQYSIIAQHLGNTVYYAVFPESAIDGLKRLKTAQDNGDILIARTSRLLEYNRNHDHLHFDVVEQGDQIEIRINAVDDPVIGKFIPNLEQLRGITFYTSNPSAVKIFIDNVKIADEEIVINEYDGYNKSIGIKWFKPDVTDYTKNQLLEN